MDTMKAVVMTGPDKPWEVHDVPVPRTEPGQVLVKVHASGMCYTDVWATQGYGGDIYPQTPGHEVVGEIVEIGAGVHTRRIGDRIGTTWVQSSCGRCPYCRENRPLTGQTAMNCVSPRTTALPHRVAMPSTSPSRRRVRSCCPTAFPTWMPRP